MIMSNADKAWDELSDEEVEAESATPLASALDPAAVAALNDSLTIAPAQTAPDDDDDDEEDESDDESVVAASAADTEVDEDARVEEITLDLETTTGEQVSPRARSILCIFVQERHYRSC